MHNDVALRRQQAGWSQAELGAVVGVSRQTINAIEKGRYDPSLPLAFKLARVFGCLIEEVFDDGESRAAALDPARGASGAPGANRGL